MARRWNSAGLRLLLLTQLAAVAVASHQSQTWSHVQFAKCVAGDEHQRWEIDSITEVTTITSAVDGRCLQAAECETSGEYARVHVDRCGVEYQCENKHTQWRPSSQTAGILGFQNMGSTKTHMCLNNVGSWAPPDNEGPTWVCTWSFGEGDCSAVGDNSQYTYGKDKTIRSPNPRPADSCVGQDCCLTALPCVAPCVPPSAWGWTFIVLLAVSSALYIGLGMAYNVKVHGMKPTIQALPHPEQWRALLGLVADGVGYSSYQLGAFIESYQGGDFGGGDFGYTPVEDIPAGETARQMPGVPTADSVAADPKSKSPGKVSSAADAAAAAAPIPPPAAAAAAAVAAGGPTMPTVFAGSAPTASTASQPPLLSPDSTGDNSEDGTNDSDEELVE